MSLKIGGLQKKFGKGEMEKVLFFLLAGVGKLESFDFRDYKPKYLLNQSFGSNNYRSQNSLPRDFGAKKVSNKYISPSLKPQNNSNYKMQPR